MAKELAHFKNFAKLKDTSVAFNDITVIAGKPGTGKSYVMKFQYAYSEAISALKNGTYKMHYALIDGSQHEQMMFLALKNIISLNDIINELINDNNYIKALEIYDLEVDNSKRKDRDDEHLYEMFRESLIKFSERQKKSLSATEEEKFHFIFRNLLESIFGSIEQIDTDFIYENSQLKVVYLEQELSIKDLEIEKGIESALFVETPLILEFENFLPTERFQTPYHIDSLLQELNKNDFSFTSDETSNFINEFRKSTSKIINGNITKSKTGFSFESESGKNYNIVNASSGIKSIGLLQYLVTNKALKKGSVLYWEEPEVHLHPEWQLRMVDLFIELMNAGVKIVFSTHSPFMADYLNAISKREDFRDRVSFNVFEEKDGVVDNYILDDNNWSMLQSELMDSFEDILWTYL